MAERTPWLHLPDVDLATPVLALASDDDRLWLGGVGGLRCLAAGAAPAGGDGREILLTSVAAICRTGRWLVAGGAEGIVRHRDDESELANVQGSGAPVAALVAIPAAGAEREDDTGVLLAGTLGDGVLRSLDRGRSWAPVSFGLDDHEVSALCVGPAGSVLAGTADGVYAATASVKAWRRCAGTQGVAVAAIAYSDDLLAAVSESGRALTSRDGGRTWTPGGTVPGQVTAMVGVHGGTLIVGTTDTGLWRSPDAGATWVRAGTDTAETADASDPADTAGDADTAGPPLAVFCLAPHAGAVYAGTADGLVVSLDAGASWRPVPAPPTHDLDRLLVVRGRPVVAGGRSGVVRLRSAPGPATGTWSALADAPFPLTAVAATPDDALIASGPAGLFRRTDDATGSASEAGSPN
ncbi:MAG: WD40/YVTN/BNR-like repeat-containing protein, partial [Micromonosporaceae bacterium]